jgi:DNA-binding phage protein
LAVSVLADLAGVARGHMFAVLGCRASPTLEWMSKVAAALEVDVADLLVAPPKT